MMSVRTLVVVGLLATAAVAPSVHASGMSCIACTLILGLLEEGQMHVQNLGGAASDFGVSDVSLCNGDANCESFLAQHGELLSRSIRAGTSSPQPDALCKNLTLCTGECILFNTWPVTPPAPPPPPTPPHWPNTSQPMHAPAPAATYFHSDDVASTVAGMRQLAAAFVRSAPGLYELQNNERAHDASGSEHTGFYETVQALVGALLGRQSATASPAVGGEFPDPCGWNITCLIHRVFDQHLPFIDEDGDDFSPPGAYDATFRGGDWRGRDCNDSDASIYPGRSDFDSSTPGVDGNCNGIYGVDTDGMSYEDKWCKGTRPMGTIILGDSAAAHFHIPPSWVRARGWNLDNLLHAAEDELDWPQCGWACGWQNTSNCPAASMPQESFYRRMFARNRCNMRDFQNIGVNGARVTSMAPQNGSGIINGMSRNQETDNPALVFFALIGNDVCNGHPGTSHMTPPAEFYSAVVASLDYLDTKLPAGSSVVIIGLVDGRILWDIMHDQIHPIGVKYADLYDYLGCMGKNPCHGWLTSNATLRNITTEWANSLNDQYTKIVATKTYKNFKMYFNNPDWRGFINKYVQAGGIAKELIEPVDGFHPSQSGNMLLAMNVWNYVMENDVSILGDVNPNNAAIHAKFGDQGGYIN